VVRTADLFGDVIWSHQRSLNGLLASAFILVWKWTQTQVEPFLCQTRVSSVCMVTGTWWLRKWIMKILFTMLNTVFGSRRGRVFWATRNQKPSNCFQWLFVITINNNDFGKWKHSCIGVELTDSSFV